MTVTLAAPAPTMGAGARLVIPTREVVEQAAARVSELIGWSPAPEPWRYPGPAHPGIHRVRSSEAFFAVVTPGVVRLERKLPRPYESHDEWHGVRNLNPWAAGGIVAEPVPEERPAAMPARVISEWSRRSRARLAERIGVTDLSPWLDVEHELAMVTLTLPDNWETLAPSGGDFKRMVRRFVRRYEREIGAWRAIWKLEFQRRGAPHMHILTWAPRRVASGERFELWALRTWAAAVGATGRDRELHEQYGVDVDRSRTYTDVARIAKYFMGHSSKKTDGKEYQHIVPRAWRGAGRGPGRFWGIAGLERLEIRVEISADAFWKLRRVLRGVHRGRRAGIALSRRRHVVHDVSEATRRRTLLDLRPFGHGRDKLLASSGGGWVLADDGPGLAVAAGTYVRAALSIREGP